MNPCNNCDTKKETPVRNLGLGLSVLWLTHVLLDRKYFTFELEPKNKVISYNPNFELCLFSNELL
mgnify:CR=1 FL=1